MNNPLQNTFISQPYVYFLLQSSPKCIYECYVNPTWTYSLKSVYEASVVVNNRPKFPHGVGLLVRLNYGILQVPFIILFQMFSMCD